jgi:hypothetical protein
MAAPGTTEGLDTLRPTPGRDDEAVEKFLHGYAQALSLGRSAEVAALWETPALLIDDGAVVTVASSAEVEGLMSRTAAQYTTDGITSTRPEITRISWVSDRIALVEVLWHRIDRQGDERGIEGVTYALRRDDSDRLRVRTAVIHAPLDRLV